MKKNVIILGASGTLGTYLTSALQEFENFNIYACGFRNLNETYLKSIGVNPVRVDINRKADFEQLPKENIAAVVQIAGVMPARMEGYNPYLYLETNVIGTLNVLEYCRLSKAPKYIFTQSHSDVAGHWNTGKLIPPDAQREIIYKGDHAVYIISKNTAVDLAENYFQDYGIKNVILRLPTIYSHRSIGDMYVNGQKSPIAYRFMIQKALAGEALEIWGDPEVTKDIVYVKDFTQLVIKSIISSKARGFYNVAYGEGISLENQVKGIADVFGNGKIELIYKPDKPSQTSYLYDVENARRDLDYNPSYDYYTMLKDMRDEMSFDRFKEVPGNNIFR